MDIVYNIGINAVQTSQYVLSDYEEFLLLLNSLTSPDVLIDYVAPVVSLYDSVFGAQLYLCLGVILYICYMLKWLIGGERPYWWAAVSDFYEDERRPNFDTFPQTCDLSPGCPSVHVVCVCIMVVLVIMWITHIAFDKDWKSEAWRVIVYPLSAVLVLSSAFSRIYIAANFVHHCAFGIFIGLFLTAAILVFACDPYIWGRRRAIDHTRRMSAHITGSIMLVPLTFVVYIVAKYIFKYDYTQFFMNAVYACKNSDWVDERNKDLINIVQSLGIIMGWSYCVTPKVDDYRYDTQTRSVVIAILASAPVLYTMSYLQSQVESTEVTFYKFFIYFLGALKPIVMLSFVPKMAMMPFEERKSGFNKNK